MNDILAVFLGGGCGSVLRFLISAVISRNIAGAFPVGTLTVNILGSLLLGVLTGLAARDAVAPAWRFFLAVGFCGGFTTFSTFSLEFAGLLRSAQYATAFAYAGASLLLCLLATFAGLWMVRS